MVLETNQTLNIYINFINIKYVAGFFDQFIFYPVPKAAKVPLGISVDGCRKSPLIFIPANTPVTVGKKTPKTVNQPTPCPSS